MRSDERYAILAVLALVVIGALAYFVSGPLLYTLEKDSFSSRFHDNPEVLKAQALNSTTDVLPLMQDLLDFTGPIVLNIRIKDIEQARRDLALFAKYRKNLDNLIIRLDMDESEIDDFSKSSEKQRALLAELMNISISLDELKQLEIQYRDQNNPNMLISVILQQEMIRQKLKELYGQYETETEKIKAISKKYNLDTSKEEDSLTEFRQVVEENTRTGPITDTSRTRIPTLSLLLKPETGQYLDLIDLSGIYSTGNTARNNYPVVVYVDNTTVARVTAGEDGIYHAVYQIEHITAGLHGVFASSGTTVSEVITLKVRAVNSSTSLDIQPVYNRPEILCTGKIVANRPVQNAPVDIILDFRNILHQTTNNAGAYQTRIRLSPGIHRVQSQFVNNSYPIFYSKSQQYEIEASRDAILSIRLLDADMSADELSVIIDPGTVSYKDIIEIRGVLSGRNVRQKKVDVFIDDTFHHSLLTGADGTYADHYVIEKIRAGPHTVFTRYSEPGIGEVYSESRQFFVNPADSRTLLEAELIGGGTGLICKGNITARAQGVSSAPVELVWDDGNIINIFTNVTGSFRQQVALPMGNHSIYARFTSRDFPVNSSRSETTLVTIVPPIDLYVRPPSVHYLDALDIGGSLHMQVVPDRDVRIILDNQNLTTLKTDMRGSFSTRYTVDQIPAGNHTVQASSGDFTSEVKTFRILAVDSNLSLVASNIPGSSRIVCSGTLAADTMPVRAAPVLILWDEQNVVETETNRYGRFEEILTLPSGKHQIRAIFNSTTQFPINPSESTVVNVEIPRIITPGNLTLHITPDKGRFGDTLDISGTLSSEKNTGEGVQIYIDGRKLDALRTDMRGIYSLRYPIDRISSGVHSVHAVSGNFRSEIAGIQIYPVDSEMILTVQQIPNTARVVCSGHIIAGNRSVSFAPVTLAVDNGTVIKIKTDKSGIFSESITLPAGTHRIQTQFNSTDIFPINPSKSTMVEINILPGLSLGVKPASGIYKDTLTVEGTLIRTDNLESDVDLFIDNNLIAAVKTDRTGRYIHKMVIEQMSTGIHTVQARSADLSSGVKAFTVLPAHSRTSLTITPVNNSALFECNGTVMAFDRAGDIIRRPVSINDVLEILSAFGRDPLDPAKRPVSAAPVALIVNNETLLEMQTDSSGRFSRVVALPTGDQVVTARFINKNFPLLTSQSKGIAVNIPLVNTSPLLDTQSPPNGMFVPVVVAAILLLFTGGSIFYLKRQSILFRARRTPADSSSETETIASSETPSGEIDAADSFPASVYPPDPNMVSTDPILARYVRILNRQGLSTAARAVYVHFTGTIAQRLHIRRHRSLTPREFLRSCRERPFAGTFSSFVAIYEQVRYGGIKSPDKEGEFEEATKKTDESLGGEDH